MRNTIYHGQASFEPGPSLNSHSTSRKVRCMTTVHRRVIFAKPEHEKVVSSPGLHRAGCFRLALAGSVLGCLLMVPSVQAAEQPSGHYRSFQEQGLEGRVDLSSQVLQLDVPEEKQSVWRDRQKSGSEAGPQEAAIRVRVAEPGQALDFVSLSMLVLKAKLFDDRLYASIELAAQRGTGTFTGKADLLRQLGLRLTESVEARTAGGSACAQILAAGRLGRPQSKVSQAWEPQVSNVEKEFLADPLRSRPTSFYTWSEELRGIFQQDRLLGSPMEGQNGILAVFRSLSSDPRLLAAYKKSLDLNERLTNPIARDGTQSLLALSQGNPDRLIRQEFAFFPRSDSHETSLVKQLYGNRPIPEGFDLADEMIRRIRDGSLKLAPEEASGWYDHVSWTLEPLVVPERTPEAARLRFQESYRKQLQALFKAALALARETHLKQLQVVQAASRVAPPEKKVKIPVRPKLTVEPLASYCERRAKAYRFLRGVLEAAFGKEAWASIPWVDAAGRTQSTLGSKLNAAEGLFHGAGQTACAELGVDLPPLPGRNDWADVAQFRAWASSLLADPDLGQDARMMVPVFYDRQRKKTKVWAFLGWSERSLEVGFATPPKVEVFKDGKPAPESAYEVIFSKNSYRIAYPVTAEAYVSQVLDREAFRRHCDQYRTQDEILKHLP